MIYILKGCKNPGIDYRIYTVPSVRLQSLSFILIKLFFPPHFFFLPCPFLYPFTLQPIVIFCSFSPFPCLLLSQELEWPNSHQKACTYLQSTTCSLYTSQTRYTAWPLNHIVSKECYSFIIYWCSYRSRRAWRASFMIQVVN